MEKERGKRKGKNQRTPMTKTSRFVDKAKAVIVDIKSKIAKMTCDLRMYGTKKLRQTKNRAKQRNPRSFNPLINGGVTAWELLDIPPKKRRVSPIRNWRKKYEC